MLLIIVPIWLRSDGAVITRNVVVFLLPLTSVRIRQRSGEFDFRCYWYIAVVGPALVLRFEAHASEQHRSVSLPLLSPVLPSLLGLIQSG